MELFLVYAICFGVGLLWALVSAVLVGVFGGMHHGEAPDHHAIGMGGHAETGYDMPGFSPFSPTVLASFLSTFGGFGMIFSKIKATSSVWISAPLSLLVAFFIASAILWFFRQMFQKTQSSSESRVAALTGLVGTVITPIPAQGVGEIAYIHAGTRYTSGARSENSQPVTQGAAVKITRIAGTQIYVAAEPIKEQKI